jgi:hypothetical protein
MSEPIPACISIGGRVPRDFVSTLCQAIRAQGMALEWGDANFLPHSAENLLAARQQHDGVWVLWLCDDSANWGRLAVLEPVLVQRGIPFNLQADGKAQYDPDLIVFRPGAEPIRILTNAAGKPVVPVEPLAAIQELLAAARSDPGRCQAQLDSAHAALADVLPPAFAPLPPFEIG